MSTARAMEPSAGWRWSSKKAALSRRWTCPCFHQLGRAGVDRLPVDLPAPHRLAADEDVLRHREVGAQVDLWNTVEMPISMAACGVDGLISCPSSAIVPVSMW